MTEYKYVVKARAQRRIRLFYQNVARKYRHTYDMDDFIRDVQNAAFGIYQIEKTLLRREPILSRWKLNGYNMANKGKWYYAYVIDGDTVTVVDACHSQNMKSSESSTK